MSAYNWITIDARCPSCEKLATLRCQTHVASDYSGDARGRFFDRDYRLGETMWWWPPGHARFASWRADGRKQALPDPSLDEEACYSNCGSCDAKLVVVLRFRENVPVEVMAVTTESSWPSDHRR